jgi:hypothetical protein
MGVSIEVSMGSSIGTFMLRSTGCALGDRACASGPGPCGAGCLRLAGVL